MTDGHVHIERGPYDRDWIMEFAKKAVERNIDEIYLLEHSHRFLDFSALYEDISAHDGYQASWLARKCGGKLSEYIDFMHRMKQTEFPVRIRWGLEVCYVPGKEALIKNITSGRGFDFLTGSVHWIDNWGFDRSADSWKGRDVNSTYKSYYAAMTLLVRSGLFDILAHPDSIKCFGHVPTMDMDSTYRTLAKASKEHGIKVELSAGLFNNYGHPEIGPDRRLLEVMKEYHLDFIAASDAHSPGDTGRNIAECYDLMAGEPHGIMGSV